MRPLHVIGIFFFLAVEHSQSAIIASCRTDQSQDLTTCFPDIDEVADEDFTISSADPMQNRILIFNNKRIKFLPKNLSRTFPDLIDFSVHNCSVTLVNGNHFKGLSKMKILDLEHNEIEHVTDDAFVDLVNLASLGLSSNRIQALGENTFASLKALNVLTLDENEIQFLHPKIFNGLVNGEYIDLSRNQISSLDENIFGSLANLKTILLSYNKLEKIPKNLFKNNFKLTDIRLGDNKIKFIDATMFDHLSNLYDVELRRNECIQENYDVGNLHSMREDLQENCTETSIQEML